MRNIYLLFAPSAEIRVKRLIMPLALLPVAASIRRSPLFKNGDRVYVCDSFREVLERADSHAGDRVHFLVSSTRVIRGLERPTNPAVECAARLRRRRPDIFFGVGGPDVSLDPEAYRPSFDLVFQGEVGSVDLLDVVRSGVPFFQAPPADINAEPLDYRPLSGKKYLAGSLQTARGCPHGCSFCNIAHFSGRAVRRLAPRLLEERLESLADIHRGFVIIGDSNFAGGSAAAMKEYLDVLFRVQERRGFPFFVGLQASLQTSRHPDILRMMRAAQVVAVYIGVESPSADVLAAAGKKHNLGDPPARQIEAFLDHGIFPYLSMILGLDGEDRGAGRRLREFLGACRSPFLMLNLINPVAGSRLREQAAAAGRLLDHPLYGEYNLIPMKTDRPYAEVIKDYAETLRWFYSDRRLLGFCRDLEHNAGRVQDRRGRDVFAAGLSKGFLLKLLVLYLGLCLKAGSWSGLVQAVKAAGKSRSEALFSLAIRSVALGAKDAYRKTARRSLKGLARLRTAELYPYERKRS